MLPIDLSLAFFAAAFVLALSPGPDNLFVLTQSALYGAKQGIFVTLGLCTGLLVHTSAVAVGVAALVMASPTLFYALKIAGGIYLLSLAWGAFRAKPTERSAIQATDIPSSGRLYCRGIIMNVTNPKVSLFFLAFLPQFTRQKDGPLALQIVWLGFLFIMSTLIVFGAIAQKKKKMSAYLANSARTQLYLNRLAGTIFAILALNIFFLRPGP